LPLLADAIVPTYRNKEHWADLNYGTSCINELNFIFSLLAQLRRQHAGVFGSCACGGIPPRLLHPACITGPQPHGRASKARLGSLGTPDWTWRHTCFIIVD